MSDVADDRFPPELEATAYFVIAEALTNVAKHTKAQEARVTVRRDGDLLVAEISDDGIGGAFVGGSGLLGLEDRLEAVGGRLQVSSPPGDGTALRDRDPARRRAGRGLGAVEELGEPGVGELVLGQEPGRAERARSRLPRPRRRRPRSGRRAAPTAAQVSSRERPIPSPWGDRRRRARSGSSLG